MQLVLIIPKKWTSLIHTLLDIFSTLRLYDFVFLFLLFQKIEHLIIPSGHLLLLSSPCVAIFLNLGVDFTYLNKNNRVKVSPLVISTAKTKYRAFRGCHMAFREQAS